MLRIGTVPFLVARPLTWGLDRHAGVELTVAPPSELVAKLRAGDLDVALASSVLSVEHPEHRLWRGGPLIACEGPVRSVLLFRRPGLTDTAQCRSIAMDPGSRAGRALARIVLRDLHRIEPEEVPVPQGGDPFECGADLVLRIGDAALLAQQDRQEWFAEDLGSSWLDLTGLPFLFAGWIARVGFDLSLVEETLGQAATSGLLQREQMAREAATRLGLPSRTLLTYLLQNIRYVLPRARVGVFLTEFSDRLASPTVVG